jgi:hypothetical protein
MVDKDWQRPLTHHLAFLKLTAVELRRIAERVPEIANYLRYIAAGSKQMQRTWRDTFPTTACCRVVSRGASCNPPPKLQHRPWTPSHLPLSPSCCRSIEPSFLLFGKPQHVTRVGIPLASAVILVMPL